MNSRSKRSRPALSLLASLALSATAATAQLTLDWHTVDGGGCTAASGVTFTMGGTAGQTDAVTLVGALYTLYGGFWLGGGAVSGLEDPPPPPSAPNEPVALRIQAGRPNPFRHSTHVDLELPDAQMVRLEVFDHGGRLLRRVSDGVLPPGRHDLAWDGTDQAGLHLPSGVYFLRLQAGNVCRRRQVLLLR